ncbi:GTA-like holin [Pseudanabaena phage Pan1]|nr:GTA-like holin [Pseudanabaena phage Pan1]
MVEEVEDLLLRKSIKWRTAAGWVLVLILIWRYLAHPVASTFLVASGNPPLAPLDPIAWEDVLAIIGLPVGGAFADRMSKEN